MRYSHKHKEDTRARLLEAAGALVKQKGFAATGVDGLMAAAGLTSGAFYSHFRSKNQLLEAIIQNELERSLALFSRLSPDTAFMAIATYLGPTHVAHPESGCVVPSLAAEIARADTDTKQVFENGILALQTQIRYWVKDEGQAWSIVAQLAGAVMIARGMPSESAQNALLQGVTHQIMQMLAQQHHVANDTTLCIDCD